MSDSERTSHEVEACSTDTDGNSGINTAGDSGINTAGESGINTAGDSGINTAGDSGINTAGDSGINTGGDSSLTDPQIEELSLNIVAKHMSTIAIKYLKLPYEEIENLKGKDDNIAFNRALLFLWRNMNPGIDQVRMSLIFQTAIDNDPQK